MDERENIIRELLHEFKVRFTYTGYPYMVYGFLLLLDQEDLLTCMVKGLYTEIGEKFGVKAFNVEKNIRTVKYAMWDMNRHHPIFKYYDCCPSNGEFMDIVLYEIERRIAVREKKLEQMQKVDKLKLKEKELKEKEQRLLQMEQLLMQMEQQA